MGGERLTAFPMPPYGNRMDISEQFNRISAEYDSKRRMFIPCFDAFYQETTAFLASCMKAPGTVIDLGAGTGLLASYWHRHFPDSRYILTDVAEGMLAVARKRFAGCGNVFFETANYAERLPAEGFDAAISALSIHHLEDQDKIRLFRNIHDRLPVGGVFVNYDQFRASGNLMDSWYSRHWEHGLHSGGLSENDLELWRERQKLDRECSVMDEIRMLKDSGFSSAECVFCQRKFAVIAAVR